jgi:MFS family permease
MKTDRPVAARSRRARRERLADSFRSLHLRDFRFLALGTIAASFGSWAKSIGFGWLVFDLTDSAAQLAGVSFVRGIVGLVAAPWGGVLLDRVDRHRVLLVTTVLNAFQAVALAALIITDLIRVEHVYVFAFVDGILSSVEASARQAMVYEVTTPETLPNAVTVNTLAMNVSRVSGPPFTGAIIGIGGTAAAFVFLAIMAALAALLTIPIRSRQLTRDERDIKSPLRDLMVGLRYIQGDRPVLGVVMMTFVPSLLVYPYISLLPIFAEEVLDSGAIGYGLLSSALGWGSLIGLVIFALAGSNPPRRGLLLLLGALGYIGCVFAFSQSRHIGLSFALLAIGGVANSFWFVLSTTLIQVLARDDVRGRVLGVWQMASSAAPLGTLPMGVLVALISAQFGVALFTGIAFVLTAIMAVSWRSLREA